MPTNTQTETTHVRAPSNASRRIAKLGKKLAKERGGSWPQSAVVDEALKVLEETKPDAKPLT